MTVGKWLADVVANTFEKRKILISSYTDGTDVNFVFGGTLLRVHSQPISCIIYVEKKCFSILASSSTLRE